MKAGEYLEQQLTDLLSKHTTLKDAAGVAAEFNLSESLILKVKGGTQKLTNANIKAMRKLVEVANKNIEATQANARKDKRQIKQFLDCV